MNSNNYCIGLTFAVSKLSLKIDTLAYGSKPMSMSLNLIATAFQVFQKLKYLMVMKPISEFSELAFLRFRTRNYLEGRDK